MEAPLVLQLPRSLLIFALMPALSQALGVPLHPNWSFSADLSLASPLPRNAHSSPSLSLFTPILSSLSFSSGKGFSLGFYSLFSSASSPMPTSIFLTVCLGTNKTDTEGRAFAAPVWHFDRMRLLKQVGKGGLVSLSVDPRRNELMLKDGDGSVVFTVSGVEAMEMQDSGNWAIYDAQNQVIWQSFDHPSDALVKGQYLKLGMKLESNNSLYVAEMMRGGLVFYYKARAPAHLTYWAVPTNVSVEQYVTQFSFELSRNPSVNLTHSLEQDVCPSSASSSSSASIAMNSSSDPPPPYVVFRGSYFAVQGACSSYRWPDFSNLFGNASSSMSDFLVLTNDGYPKGFTYLHSQGENALFSDQANSSYCLAPYTCGPYSICRELLFGLQHTCECPSSYLDPGFQDVFALIDPSDSTQGCRRTAPLECSDGSTESQALVEIKRSSIVSIHILYETTYARNTLPLQACVARCVSNCSCSGFFYHRGSSFCLPFSDFDTGDVPDLTFITMESSDFSTYIKIQKPGRGHGNGRGRSHNSGRLSKAAVLMMAGGAVVLLLAAMASLLAYRYMKRPKASAEQDETEMIDEDLQKVLPDLPTRFSFKELARATDGFSRWNVIGSGAFGCVYKAVFPHGTELAVKKLHQGSLCFRQFLAEVAIMGKVSHVNITPLHGYCSERSHRLLVYEFMENGSLAQWLFSDGTGRSVLDWSTRYKIALGTALGLTYLHEQCQRHIVHFDVKPQNILLDREFVAKISDFGMCMLMGRTESSCVMTGVRGTPGYLAPEFLSSHGVVGKKCDVYSYGMVLMEVVGGRRNAVPELMGSEYFYLPRWAALLWKQGRFREVVDKRLRGRFDEAQAKKMIHVAFLCIQREPSLRPSMGAVCQMIEGSLAVGEEDPPFDMHMFEALSPEQSPASFSCTSILLEGR